MKLGFEYTDRWIYDRSIDFVIKLSILRGDRFSKPVCCSVVVGISFRMKNLVNFLLMKELV